MLTPSASIYATRRSARLAAFLLAACALLSVPTGAVAGSLTLAVALNPMSLPLFIAERERYYAAEGLSVRTLECLTGARCMALMLDGAADVATAADTPVVFRSFERTDFALIATFASSPDDAKIITRKRNRIERPADLAGRRVGLLRGTSGHYFLDAYLLLYGVDPKLVHAVDLTPEEMPKALLSGKVDALSIFEPLAWRTLQALHGDAVRLPSPDVYSVTFNLVAHRRLVGARDADLSALLRAVERAERLIREQPERAQRILVERLGGDQGFVDWVWPTLQFRLGLEQSLIKTLESEARWALREGHVTGKGVPNYLNYVNTDALRAAVPDAVVISR